MAIISNKAIVLSDYSYITVDRTSSVIGTKSHPYDWRQYSYIKISSSFSTCYACINSNALVILDQSTKSVHCDFYFVVFSDTTSDLPNLSSMSWKGVGQDGGWKGILQFLGGNYALMITEVSNQNTIGGQTGDIFNFYSSN